MLDKLQRKILRRFSLPQFMAAAPLKMGDCTFLTPKIGVDMCEVQERWMFDLLTRLGPLKQGTFLDVGVNLGQSLLSLRACDRERRYIGIEPNAQCVAYVEQMIELNNLQNCDVVPVGLAKETGLRQLQLYYGATCDSSASIVKNFRPDQNVAQVKIVPVFSFASLGQAVDLSNLGIVKIDVEGAEAEILWCMREAIQGNQPWMLVEILPCYRENNHERIEQQNAIEQLLAEIGYIKFRILRGMDGRFLKLETLDKIGIHANLDWCDYLFCPSSDVGRLDKFRFV